MIKQQFLDSISIVYDTIGHYVTYKRHVNAA